MTKRILSLLVVLVLCLACIPAMAEVDLKGTSQTLSIVGIGGWKPSSLAQEMGEELYAQYCKENYGYDVSIVFDSAPFDALFQKAATEFAAGKTTYNLIISDSQWLGAMSEAGWIVKLNDIIAANPALDVDWYSQTASASYQLYPDGSEDVYGLPQEADVLIMYVRGDYFTDETERANFLEKYGWELPKDASVDEWLDIDFVKYAQICEFFTRPDEGIYGTTIQYSKVYDYLTGSLYPYFWSAGEEVWDPATGKVSGVLNTAKNAEMLVTAKNMMNYCPPGAIDVDISGIIDNFVNGKAVTGWQWAAQGADMQIEGVDVWGVILPGYRNEDGTVTHTSSLGGQPWVINAFNTEEQMQVVVDFLNWWYTDETQTEFARRGGSPLGTNVINAEGFEELQPWFTAYKYMMQEGNCKDFWHHPAYAELLATQQEEWTAFMAGTDNSIEAAQAVLDSIAEKQDAIISEYAN